MQQNQNPNKVAATEAPRRVISLLVDNHNGVLARVSSLFCRRGFNIDSLTVSATNDPAVSRITVTLHGDDAAISQLILQTERLEVTRQVFELTPDKSLQRELLLLKVACNTAERAEMREIATIYKSKIIDLSPDSMVFELTGRPEKINAFLKMFSGSDILELCRTGKRLITEETRKEMKKVLTEIQDGTFASEFLTEMSPKGGRKVHFLAQRRMQSEHLIEKVGKELRGMMSWMKK